MVSRRIADYIPFSRDKCAEPLFKGIALVTLVPHRGLDYTEAMDGLYDDISCPISVYTFIAIFSQMRNYNPLVAIESSI